MELVKEALSMKGARKALLEIDAVNLTERKYQVNAETVVQLTQTSEFVKTAKDLEIDRFNWGSFGTQVFYLYISRKSDRIDARRDDLKFSRTWYNILCPIKLLNELQKARSLKLGLNSTESILGSQSIFPKIKTVSAAKFCLETTDEDSISRMQTADTPP